MKPSLIKLFQVSVLSLLTAGCNDGSGHQNPSSRLTPNSDSLADDQGAEDGSEESLSLAGYFFEATAITSTEVTLKFGGPIESWAKDGKFLIRKSTTRKKNSFKDIAGDLSPGSLVDSSLTADTKYYYKLYRSGGASNNIDTVAQLSLVTLPAPVGTPATQNTAAPIISPGPSNTVDETPKAPAPIDAKQTTNTSVTITWNGLSAISTAKGKVEYFQVRRRVFTSTANFEDVGRVTFSAQKSVYKFVDTGLTPDQLYFYQVISVSPTGLKSGPVADSIHMMPNF